MHRLVRYLIVLPVALLFIAFSIANRSLVGVRLDPFAGLEEPAAVELPLFILLVCALVIGLIFGGGIVWFAQGKHRKAARIAQRETERLRQEAARMASVPAERTYP
jgi:Lipopolysaccharide assembly protein A domain